ncbi:helix-turn-helix domain-containing protein [Desulfoferrobacter suflitae]|uniref:helix-turn-helix domain-containing protein n=1 Tax=Desulfoferrobacter suflitae TaxID=2865782 RepID=UPI0021642F4A|nr:helix-turn-helix domain-containing protein [Desulfoferrobacter suflitae]MCK8604413.1 helix-turn-helix domain-containing protein [Desulfoferrobacter suflitae]
MGKCKYVWTEEQDEAIRTTYKEHYYRGAITKLAAHPLFAGYPKWQIQLRSITIGVSRETKRWTQEEEALVTKHAGQATVSRIKQSLHSKGYIRSRTAIKGKIQSARLRQKPDTYSVSEVAVGFRCSRDKVVRWIKAGMLRAYKDQPGSLGHWRIKPIHLARFIRSHLFELEACMPDIPWLVSLIDEFRSDYRKRISTDEEQASLEPSCDPVPARQAGN